MNVTAGWRIRTNSRQSALVILLKHHTTLFCSDQLEFLHKYDNTTSRREIVVKIGVAAVLMSLRVCRPIVVYTIEVHIVA